VFSRTVGGPSTLGLWWRSNSCIANRLAEHVDRLAHHAFRGEVWDKAVAYFRQAGRKLPRAQPAGKRSRALSRRSQRSRIFPRVAKPSSRRSISGWTFAIRFFPLGEFQQIFDHLCEGEKLAERVADQRRLGWISAYMCAHFWIAGESDRAVESGHRALAVAKARGNFPLQVVASLRLGMAYMSLGDHRRGSECFRSNIESSKAS